MPQAKLFLLLAAANGAVAVILGAFGAHALKNRLSDTLLQTWQTAVQYHFVHVLALLGLGILMQQYQSRWFYGAGALFTAGMVLFCGSLYVLALGGPRWLGPVTPLGGLCFILAWAALFAGLLWDVRQ